MPATETSSKQTDTPQSQGTTTAPTTGGTASTTSPGTGAPRQEGGSSSRGAANNGAGQGGAQGPHSQGRKDPEADKSRIRKEGYLKAIGKAPQGTTIKPPGTPSGGEANDGEQPGAQTAHGNEGGTPSGEGSPSSSSTDKEADERSKLAERNEKLVDAKAFIRRFTKGKYSAAHLDGMSNTAVLELCETLKERHADFGRELNARGNPGKNSPPEESEEAAGQSGSPPSAGKGNKPTGSRQSSPGGKANAADAIPAGLEAALKLMDPDEADQVRSSFTEMSKLVADADTRSSEHRNKEASFHFATGLSALEADFPMLKEEAGVQRLAEFLMVKPERKHALLSGDVDEIHATMRDAAKVVFFDQIREKAQAKAKVEYKNQVGSDAGGTTSSRSSGSMGNGSKPSPEQIRKAGFRAAKEGRTPEENRALMTQYLHS